MRLETYPANVDLHVHLRDPSTNKAETMASGTDAAAMGGYILVRDMSNNPGKPTWTVDRLEEKKDRIIDAARIGVATYQGSQPESDNIGEIEGMARAGAEHAKYYATHTTGNDGEYEPEDFEPQARELRRVTPNAKAFLHAGRDNLEDFLGKFLVDIGLPTHVCHVNNPDDVDIIMDFRRRGYDLGMLSSGVTPHHLTKTGFARRTEGVFAEVKPDLATEVDAEKLMWQLAEGQVDVVETDHAPHSKDTKMDIERLRAHDCGEGECFGLPNIEFAFPVLAYQVSKGLISMDRLIDAMSTKPAEIAGVRLNDSTRATWDMNVFRVDDENELVKSGSGWTPFLGQMAIGKLQSLEVQGQAIVWDGKFMGNGMRKFIRVGEAI